MKNNFAFKQEGKPIDPTPEQMQERAEKERTEKNIIFGEARKTMVATDKELEPIRKRLVAIDEKIKKEEKTRKKAVEIMYKADGRSMEDVMKGSLAAEEEQIAVAIRPGQDRIEEIDNVLRSLADDRQNAVVDMHEVLDRYIAVAVQDREKAIEGGAVPTDLTIRGLDESLARMRRLLDNGNGEEKQETVSNSAPVHRNSASGGDNGGGDAGNLDRYIDKKIEIEHILPNTPTTELIAPFVDAENYNNYKIKLGNLTLLEKPHNIVAGRDYFEKKKYIYGQSTFYLTKSIAQKDNVGNDTAVTRINDKLIAFDRWESKDIENRQEMLLALSKDVWDIKILL